MKTHSFKTEADIIEHIFKLTFEPPIGMHVNYISLVRLRKRHPDTNRENMNEYLNQYVKIINNGKSKNFPKQVIPSVFLNHS